MILSDYICFVVSLLFCFLELSLPLFMFWDFADNINAAFASEDLAIFADFFHRCSYFHIQITRM